MGSLAGNVYSNINQREDDIAKAFENSLSLLQGSKNNTKENVKVNIIAGRGRNTENTDGVTGYDYATTGVLALREVERTYKHTFGYSMGYLHTGFEFKDGNQSEEWVDTIQLGVHNKYTSDNWKVINNLTGRVGFHNIDRNIDWPSPTGRSEMNGTYETYSITSDNILGKEIALGKKASITPYGAFRAMYVTRPDFSEKGLEALEVEGNDAWSAKPRAGVELKGAALLGSNSGWQLKGSLDVAYEYELADLNEREKARLVSVEDNYHKLSKPEDEKGTFRTRATVGVEVEDRYGIFVSGEYGIGDNDQDDYRVGVTLKAVF
nr:autotransporter outer membrane beta-barrel domain-containing protein [Sebaldella sp. S0638]